MEKIIIAVDAGGTKTKVCAIDKNKNIIYKAVGGAGSPATVKEEAFKNIKKLVEEAVFSLKDRYLISLIQMGISGFGIVLDIKKIEAEFASKFDTEVSIESDVTLAMYSIVTDKYDEGILVLSGTGSACFGINKDETFMVGGFGHLLTENGSGYISVKMLIVSIIKLYEETKTYSELGKKFMNHIGATKIGDFRSFVYQKTKGEIAQYAQFITEEALKQDNQAIDILKKCGKDLADSVQLLYKHLNLSHKAVIGFRGSFIQNAPFVKDELIRCLELSGYNPEIVEGVDDPIFGAYYMALRKGKLC